jgi:hypothetical protein
LPVEEPKRHVFRFVAVAGLVSVVLGVPLLLLLTATSSEFVGGLASLLLAAVPAWSIIAAAVGIPTGRKLRAAVGLLGFVLAFGLIGYWTGWQQMTSGSQTTRGGAGDVLAFAYILTFMATPVVALVLFVGKRPSALWESPGR